jgi:outer membrane immunogenic protein
MRKQLLGGVAAIALTAAGSANAQQAFDWTGFYLGVHAGYSAGKSDANNSGPFLAQPGASFDMDGPLGGLHLGINKQNGNFVWGVETDVTWTGQDGSGTNAFVCSIATCQAGNPFFATTPAAARPVVITSFNQKLDWFGTLRGRFGVTMSPAILAYVTGGLAVGYVTTDGVITGNAGSGAAVTAGFSNSEMNLGWTIGAGIEGALGGNWIWKIDYLYLDFGTTSTFVSLPANFIPINQNFESKLTDHVVRGGISFKFP